MGWDRRGALLLNAILNSIWIFWLHLGHEYLALSTTIVSFFNFLAIHVMMWHFECPRCHGTMRNAGKLLRREEIEYPANATA